MNANNGVLDKSFRVNWENYKSSLILLYGNDIRKIDIKFKTFVQLIEKK